ncbi:MULTISPECIES: 3,4-dihydroxy-2-butanone-4-phosphate synthase [Amycolatopsis]|uniref:3,4-dihydroxy-2-butanone-4-phosphate synthase n=1 Tax=Amycolatopsis TaxID=1813 RepID=UPI000B8B159C|nr:MULTISPECIES: 3,4-dihydroxy-2-butanone-4-phosphate synthase [Amycolatopsis]OXM67171.1 bifunctional 3,4-dihydroxy-2-butanone-4-phosphate synthase/GTP cyclohydrolase II [Amycolatopsis sp. KNN50.9b]
MTLHLPGGATSTGTGVERAVAAMVSGKPVVLADDRTARANGFLVMAAETVTTGSAAFFVRHSSGLLCVALPGAECDRLDLPAMTGAANDPDGLAACVTVDAASGISTGISAHDRARTVALLANPESSEADFIRPGHVIPVRAAEGGVFRRDGVAEAAADLARAAGRRPVALFAALDSALTPTELAHGAELDAFARAHGLVTVSISDVIAHRLSTEPLVSRKVTARLPLQAGVTRTVGYHGLVDGAEHLALVVGRPRDGEDVPVHIHLECLTGDVFGSLRCECRYRLDRALATITAEGTGVVVYLRPSGTAGHRGSAVGRFDTGRMLSSVAAHILRDLGVRSVQLLTDNVGHRAALQDRGLPTRIHGLAVAAIS